MKQMEDVWTSKKYREHVWKHSETDIAKYKEYVWEYKET